MTKTAKKKRMRRAVRSGGWHLVEVPVDVPNVMKQERYDELRNWCRKTFHEDDFMSSNSHMHYNSKYRFAFRHEKHANFFKLKWA